MRTKNKVQTLNKVLSRRLSDSKQRAKKYDREHTIDRTYLDALYAQSSGKCPLSGLPFSMVVGDKLSPSLDRIDSSKGYIPGNVWFIAHWINIAKNDMDLKQFKGFVNSMADNLGRSTINE